MNTPHIERRKAPRLLPLRLIRIQDVMGMCGLSRAGLYRQIQAGSFPAPVKISGRASAWVKHEVEDWCQRRLISDPLSA